MSDLRGQKCTPCRSGDPPISDDELRTYLQELPDWSVITDQGVRKLTRQFRFRNFRLALEFTNRVGAMAEENDHHPLLCTEWGRVTVTWWTHAISDLHRNDLIMAARTDQQFGGAS